MGYLRQHQTDESAALLLQSPGKEIGNIIQLSDDFQDSLFGVLFNSCRIGDNARDGCD